MKSLEENTAITMDNEQLGNREIAFTSYVLSQIATKVGAENYEILHAEIKNSAGSYLGEIYAYNKSENQEVLTLFYTIYDASSNATGTEVDDTSALESEIDCLVYPLGSAALQPLPIAISSVSRQAASCWLPRGRDSMARWEETKRWTSR